MLISLLTVATYVTCAPIFLICFLLIFYVEFPNDFVDSVRRVHAPQFHTFLCMAPQSKFDCDA